MPESATARRSADLVAELLACPAGEVVAAVASPGGRGAEAVALLLGRDWGRLVEHVRGPDGSCPAGFAWRAGYALHHLGHLGDALAVVSRAETAGAGDADLSRLAGVAAAAEWSRGDEARCRELVDLALKHAQAGDDPGAEAAAWVVRALVAASDGDREANLSCYQRARVLAQQADDLLTQERICNNLGSRALEEGRWHLALEELGAGLALNQRTGHVSGQAVLRHNTSEALVGLGRLDEALVECDLARELWNAVEAPSVCVCWQLRGDIQVARGNATQAALSYRRASDLAAAEGDAQTLAVALAGEATALVRVDPDRAAELAGRAATTSVPNGHAIPLVLAGWTRLALGEHEQAGALAARALRVAGEHDDLPRVADALELAALADGSAPAPGGDPRLGEAGRIWRELGHPLRSLANEVVVALAAHDLLAADAARAELRALGVHDDAWRIAGPLLAQELLPAARRAEVQVRVLGGFAVEVDGDPVAAGAWPSRKAREVLKVLAVRGERGVTREVLGALVWPNADAVGNRLSIALSQIRSVLDPGRRHPADHFLRAARDVVSLDLRRVEVDVVAFTTAARAALAAARGGGPRVVRLLEAAAARHTGELFEDDPYAAWAAAERDEVEGLGRDLVRALAEHLADGDRPADALVWSARLVATDPYDEPGWLALVRLLAGLGRWGEARRHHGSYTQRMAELGVGARSWSDVTGLPD